MSELGPVPLHLAGVTPGFWCPRWIGPLTLLPTALTDAKSPGRSGPGINGVGLARELPTASCALQTISGHSEHPTQCKRWVIVTPRRLGNHDEEKSVAVPGLTAKGTPATTPRLKPIFRPGVLAPKDAGLDRHPRPSSARSAADTALTFEGHGYVGDAAAARGQLRGLRVQHPLHVADAVAVDGLGAEPQGGRRVHPGNVVLTGEGRGGRGGAAETHTHRRAATRKSSPTGTRGGRRGAAWPPHFASLRPRPKVPGLREPCPFTLNTWKTASSSTFQSSFPLTLLHPRKNSCCFKSYQAGPEAGEPPGRGRQGEAPRPPEPRPLGEGAHPSDDVLRRHPHHHPQGGLLLGAAADAVHGRQVCRRREGPSAAGAPTPGVLILPPHSPSIPEGDSDDSRGARATPSSGWCNRRWDPVPPPAPPAPPQTGSPARHLCPGDSG